MYLMYVDESGDCGLKNSPTKHYILSAIVVHEVYWSTFINDLIAFRRRLRANFGLLMKEEIHAAEFMSKRIKLRNPVSSSKRFEILKKSLEWLSTKNYLSIITVRIDKAKSSDPFIDAWTTLMQRYENTLKCQNFPTPAFKTDNGIIISDDTDARKLTKQLRKMRKINYIPNMATKYGGGARNLPLQMIVKDPIFRASTHSYILQMVDIVAYFAKQFYDPCKMVRSKGGRGAYGKLLPIVNKKANYRNTPHKIIEL